MVVQGRNPLALAHYVNHPGEGQVPNVMVASVDLFVSGDRTLRQHIPNVVFRGKNTTLEDEEDILPTIVFVAIRDLLNEEIFLNYRLSPHVSRPSWYTPIDTEEDWRRWS